MRIYDDRDSAVCAKWAVAKAMGCAERDLVVVRYGTGWRKASYSSGNG